MYAKDTIIAFVGISLLINSISSIPTPDGGINQRFKRQSEDDDNNNDGDDIASRISSITDSSGKIIENISSTLQSSSKTLTELVEAKRRIAEPLLEALAKILESLAESRAIERTIETVGTVASAGIKATTGIATALSRAGDSATPGLIGVATTAGDIGGRIIRLAICTLICPIQSGDEREKCQKDNCGPIDKSDNLDEYDGDYEEYSEDDV